VLSASSSDEGVVAPVVGRMMDALQQWAPYRSAPGATTAATAAPPTLPPLTAAEQTQFAAAVRAAAPALPPPAALARMLKLLISDLEAAPELAEEGVADALYELQAAADAGAPPLYPVTTTGGDGGWISLRLAMAGVPAVVVRAWKSARFSDIATNVWPATYALIDACVAVPAAFAGKVVVELGAGTGLAALAARACWECLPAAGAPAAMVVTDGDSRAVALMADNIAAEDAARSGSAARCHAIPMSAAALRWGVDAAAPPLSLPPTSPPPLTVIIGSDLVYDPADVPLLVATLSTMLNQPPLPPPPPPAIPVPVVDDSSPWAALCLPGVPFALIASTLRQPATYAAFLDAARDAGLVHIDATHALEVAQAASSGGGVVTRYASMCAAAAGDAMRAAVPLRDTLRLDILLPPYVSRRC